MGIIAQRRGVGVGVLLGRRRLAHGEGRGFSAISSAYLVVDIGDVALHGAVAQHQRLGYLTISLTLGKELQYFPLTLRQVGGIFHCRGRLGPQAFLPGGHLLHQWPRPTQLK